jgi:hypothetical protein
MRVIVEQLVEWRLAGETDVLEETQRHFVHHKIPHDQTRARTRAAAVRSLWLTAWAMARPRNSGNSALCSKSGSKLPSVGGTRKKKKTTSLQSEYLTAHAVINPCVHYNYCAATAIDANWRTTSTASRHANAPHQLLVPFSIAACRPVAG